MSSSEEIPLVKQKKAKTKKQRAVKKEDQSSEDEPLLSKEPKRKKKAVKKENSSDDEPLTKKVKKEVVKKERKKKGNNTEKADNNVKKEDEEEEEEYKWWLDQNKDDGVKWNTLEHNGPLFPPEYTPHGIKMKYDGKPISLSPAAEEVATFFAGVVGTDWGNNVTFQENFFKDFLEILKNEPGNVIKEFGKCDFTPIVDHLNFLKEEKKKMTKEEKKALKEEKQKTEEKYAYCLLDGRKEKVGNFRIEPPGLFRGRGEHPKTGSLKCRVTPEMVTINISEGAKIPEAPDGHQWGSVIHDNTVTWLAMWKENVNESFKYVFLAANSSLKGQSDFKKFEKARELKKCIDAIRKEYTLELKDEQMAIRQRATALYFIDRLALRAGNEKGDDEADTVGCCSLRFEHITLEPPNKVIFDFLGKDSIRYYNEVEVDSQVFKNIKIFKREPKKEGDPLFDRLDTNILNKHLKTKMDGLTAKVFRTYNASYTFQEELKKTPKDASVAEKILAYNRANRQVAILCNHQRAVPKAHGNQINRLSDKILLLKYERYGYKQDLLDLDPKLKKSRPELVESESELDDENKEKCKKLLAEQAEAKNKAKLDKLNEKRAAEGLEPLKALEAVKSPSKITAADKLEKKIIQLGDRIKAQKTQLIDKDENKTTALGTSKINYIDPRISAAWCHKYDVPLEKIFNRSLREKFKWAMEVDKEWIF